MYILKKQKQFWQMTKLPIIIEQNLKKTNQCIVPQDIMNIMQMSRVWQKHV